MLLYYKSIYIFFNLLQNVDLLLTSPLLEKSLQFSAYANKGSIICG